MKLVYSLLIAFLFLNTVSYAVTPSRGTNVRVEQKIDAAKNARLHNNMGNINFQEKNYVSALKEYQIAFNLSYNTTAAAVYLYNIARCAMALGNFEMAKNALLGAIQKDCINMTYYSTLVDCYIALNTADDELLNLYKDDSNPYNKIIIGLIYQKTGFIDYARITYQNFIDENPDMLISDDLRAILKRL